MPARMKARVTAGPAWVAATTPVSTKMPTPMMPPRPMAVSCQRPSTRRKCWPSPASCCNRSMDLRLESGEPMVALLFPDAEAGEDPPQQIVAGELAGDLAQGELRQPQVLRQQLPGARLGLIRGGVEVLPGTVQGIEMPAPGAEASRLLLETRRVHEVFAQEIHPLPRLRR